MEDKELERILMKKMSEMLRKEKEEKKTYFNKPIKLTYENFNDVISKNEFVVVDFWAEWCYPCKLMEPIIEDLARKYTNVVFGKVNVDEEPALANSFGIMSIPTLLFFYKGKPIEALIGARPKYEIERIIEKYLMMKNMNDK
ncbi:MAG: thioredoxin [Thermoproteota archaeon]|jgi:thioredoxin 1|nr:thioredoxin [Thermoproteota archaeon]